MALANTQKEQRQLQLQLQQPARYTIIIISIGSCATTSTIKLIGQQWHRTKTTVSTGRGVAWTSTQTNHIKSIQRAAIEATEANWPPTSQSASLAPTPRPSESEMGTEIEIAITRDEIDLLCRRCSVVWCVGPSADSGLPRRQEEFGTWN